MTPSNSQRHDQQASQPRSTNGLAPQRTGRRPSQPRFVLQPVVLDDTVTATTGQPSDVSGMNEQPENEAPCAAERQPGGLNELRDSQHVPHKNTPLDHRILMTGRYAMIGTLLICGVIAIMLFLTLLLAGRGSVI